MPFLDQLKQNETTAKQINKHWNLVYPVLMGSEKFMINQISWDFSGPYEKNSWNSMIRNARIILL